jgi:16S rRNA (uracil1498-N3)-methyltransferase
MTQRYFVPPTPVLATYIVGTNIDLPDEEAAHASRVMRVRTEEKLVVFDGRGNEADATVIAIDRRSCIVRIEEVRNISRMPRHRLTIAGCLPKPDRAKEMIERLTELGVERYIPILADRTQRPPTDSLLEKMRRVVIEACKQSGRNTLMLIEDAATLSAAISQCDCHHRWIAHPNLQRSNLQTSNLQTETNEESDGEASFVLIGPEGGFTDDEVKLAVDHQFQGLHLGDRILRIETAAAVAATLLLFDSPKS